jgi:hypothetical protein
MNEWSLVHQQLEAGLDWHQQHEVDLALREVEQAMAVLVRLGKPVHLRPGHAPPGIWEWPRTVYSVFAPQGREVSCQAELDELGSDWFPSLEEAQHEHGMRVQFAGRGGVGANTLPAIRMTGIK